MPCIKESSGTLSGPTGHVYLYLYLYTEMFEMSILHR